ncbi:hypothetical protein [Aliivibrio finisterrensis]|mgnify:CR=1 FL=1|uniref:Uncharacterized protein n=1 Tax=Aliivibrio finisterrensis TaxID=511998 RepID=A0ABY0I5Y8_9GAMM|nr:hypothetical protein [Aliivibrio finisterrensis]RYU64295.1 hypothetical protein ERW53_10155 [Aliivibrio finisterrensis]RYU83907.1 hypothetical protein ERW52_11995 [Aliivibrio finisterrensis]
MLSELYTQAEMLIFFDWCKENVEGFEESDCDESFHYYVNDIMIGGWAGDAQQYFLKDDDKTKALLQECFQKS